MDSSRRAVEAYRRTRLIDGVTTDDDKVAPVYKLDEISSVLESSPLVIVQEIVEYIFKRLEHRSPIVKQKTLRLIKFIVNKSGNDFKREVQRQSAAVRQLFHYKGKPDALKGDSLNKAVRDTAHDAIAAMFAAEEKHPVIEETSKRIEGFGNNFEPRIPHGKKTLLDEVVDLGATSIKQGLTILSTHYNNFSNGGNHGNHGFKGSGSNGSYEAPSFRRSSYNDHGSSYRESRDSYGGSYTSDRGYGGDRTGYGGDRGSYTSDRASYSSENRGFSEPAEPEQEASGSDADDGKENGSGLTDEENLLNKFTPVGGVRLQPSREKVQAFLLEAQKLKPEKLYTAFEGRLQAQQSWQVRLKTLCFLEAALRQREIKGFGELRSLFEENNACVLDCENSPQSSLRERAKKVRQMLSGEATGGSAKFTKAAHVDLPDLMDTTTTEKPSSNGLDLLAELADSVSPSKESDPFAEPEQDPFAGMAIHATTQTTNTTLDDSLLQTEAPTRTTTDSSLFEGLSIADEAPKLDTLVDLLAGLDVESSSQPPVTSVLGSSSNAQLKGWPSQQPAPQFSGIPQAFHPGSAFPQQGITPQVFPQQGIPQQIFPQIPQQVFPQQGIPQQVFPQQGIRQQGLPQRPHDITQQGFPLGFNMGMPQPTGFGGMQSGPQGTYGGSDGFDFSTNPHATSAGVSVRKEDTKAFDFISDHVFAARKK